MIRHLVIASVLLLAACGGLKGEVHLEPGEWETRIESVKVQGAPQEVTASMTATTGSVERQCITPEKAADMFGGGSGQGCKQEGDGFRNGRIDGKLTCTYGDPLQTSIFEMSGSYSARSYDMTQKVTNPFGSGTIITETRSVGRHIGDCPAKKE